MRLIATLVIIIFAALPGLLAGWPEKSPAFLAGSIDGVPMSVATMSGLMLAFVVIAAICGIITRKDGAPGREGGQ